MNPNAKEFQTSLLSIHATPFTPPQMATGPIVPSVSPPVAIPSTIFVGGLSQRTAASVLEDHFRKFGGVRSVRIKSNIDETGRLNRFGFVTLNSRNAATRAINEKDPIFDGHIVSVRIAKSQYFCPPKEYATSGTVRRPHVGSTDAVLQRSSGWVARGVPLFICGLANTTDEHTLYKYFRDAYGAVINVTVNRKMNGISKGNAIVTVGSRKAALRAVCDLHILDGVSITVKYSKFQPQYGAGHAGCFPMHNQSPSSAKHWQYDANASTGAIPGTAGGRASKAEEQEVARIRQYPDIGDIEVFSGGSGNRGTLGVLKAADIDVLWSAPLCSVREAMGRPPK